MSAILPAPLARSPIAVMTALRHWRDGSEEGARARAVQLPCALTAHLSPGARLLACARIDIPGKEEGEEDGEESVRVPAFVARHAAALVLGEPLRTVNGEYYCFMMTHGHCMAKNRVRIYMARNPLYAVYVRNHLLVNDKQTRNDAPTWQLEVVLGPFASDLLAWACGQQWVCGTRGQESKRARGLELAARFGTCYYGRERTTKD